MSFLGSNFRENFENVFVEVAIMKMSFLMMPFFEEAILKIYFDKNLF